MLMQSWWIEVLKSLYRIYFPRFMSIIVLIDMRTHTEIPLNEEHLVPIAHQQYFLVRFFNLFGYSCAAKAIQLEEVDVL